MPSCATISSTRRPRRVWGKGRVTLLGDAAHATTPNLGQGACQALEDAIILAHSLRGMASAEAGLRAYEARRRERVNFVIDQSRQVGKALPLSNPVAVWLLCLRGTVYARASLCTPACAKLL